MALIKCPNCGEEVISGSNFCGKCGCQIDKKKKPKKKIIIFLILFLILSIFSIAIIRCVKEVQKREEQRIVAEVKERERQELIKKYYLLSSKLYEEIMYTKNDFSILSSMFETSTGLNANLLGESFLIEYVQGLCAENIINEKNMKVSIDNIVSELDFLECKEPEVEDLSVALESLYGAYTERYELLVIGNFSANNFDNLNKSSKKNFDEKLDRVKEILRSIDLDSEDE